MRQYTEQDLRERLAHLGFVWPQNHLIGVRADSDTPDAYDDSFYWIEDGKLFGVFTGTTNPGSYYLQNFINKIAGGTAVMASNQQVFEGFVKGTHKERECWRQHKPFRVYRDEDKDLKSEEAGLPFVGIYGIHIHAMFKNTKSVRIFNWSAACQGMNDPDQWKEFMTRSYIKVDRLLTYTLLKEF